MTNKSLWIILIIIVLIALGISVYAWWVLKVEEETSPVTDETANWKTYRNEEYGYEVKYPRECSDIQDQTMSVEEKEQRKYYGTLFFGQEIQLNYISFVGQILPKFSITVYDNSKNTDLKELAAEIITDAESGKLPYKLSDISWSSMKVDRHEAIKATYQNKIGGYDGLVSPVFIKKGNRVYRLFLLGPPDEKRLTYDELNNQILSTFKFLE